MKQTLIRQQQVKDDIAWDLITKLLTFDRKDRISCSDALKHPFFTGEQAMKEISPLSIELAQTAEQAKQNGDKNSINSTSIGFNTLPSSASKIQQSRLQPTSSIQSSLNAQLSNQTQTPSINQANLQSSSTSASQYPSQEQTSTNIPSIGSVTCPSCNGVGKRPKIKLPMLKEKCKPCDGSGKISQNEQICHQCDGRGEKPDVNNSKIIEQCQICNGNGKLSNQQKQDPKVLTPNITIEPQQKKQNTPQIIQNAPQKEQNSSQLIQNPPQLLQNPPQSIQSQPQLIQNPPLLIQNPPQLIQNPPQKLQNPPQFKPNPPQFKPNPPQFKPNPPQFKPNPPQKIQIQQPIPQQVLSFPCQPLSQPKYNYQPPQPSNEAPQTKTPQSNIHVQLKPNEKICSSCDGNGEIPMKRAGMVLSNLKEYCVPCGGKGVLQLNEEVCQQCEGRGKVPNVGNEYKYDRCENCDGVGKVSVEAQYSPQVQESYNNLHSVQQDVYSYECEPDNGYQSDEPQYQQQNQEQNTSEDYPEQSNIETSSGFGSVYQGFGGIFNNMLGQSQAIQNSQTNSSSNQMPGFGAPPGCNQQ
ncbi:MAG: hypothetical protein EZS28_032992 [Streblomastix strix]|uniref:CR-type domain-containing protein n=1 Tax=Streblomastix strix TaxID=222440 RepID=A0A5J4UN77_9EUKA|nr:MAG: hypothetical protein EZS28_032992 [Streblomastix strix]